ncbi:MAG: metal-dependent transcriptional regulator [Caldilineae bacterium]|nr:MAG: metal-dependent transcriptional regulator [Caldilineae bacterium]
MHTQAVEDYLKVIYEIQREQGKVATTVLAERMGVSPPSVTGMLKKLADLHLVVYERYQGVTLTEAGRKIALEVIRHHRLVELYLAEALGVPWDRVHDEAEKWEHVLSEDLEDRIDQALGYPTLDPHGAPIPARDGTVVHVEQERLSELAPGQRALIAEVSDHDPGILRRLGQQGLFPATEIEVIETGAEEMCVRSGDHEHVVPLAVAAYIFVRPIG